MIIEFKYADGDRHKDKVMTMMSMLTTMVVMVGMMSDDGDHDSEAVMLMMIATAVFSHGCKRVLIDLNYAPNQIRLHGQPCWEQSGVGKLSNTH